MKEIKMCEGKLFVSPFFEKLLNPNEQKGNLDENLIRVPCFINV